ncbi:hypothetical protein [Peribacillus asahii]|uniref:hypothetical protein n=1 Tax=Peribacillus asahii TaxID=228899 RepID=UPI0037FE9700
MAYQQKDYYISAKDNEYYQVLNIVKHRLQEAKQKGNYGVWGETLEKLLLELEENQGENLTPWHYNMIIMILLDFVPENIKED